MVATEKKFVLTHIFKNVSKMKDSDFLYSPEENLFNVPWFMLIARKDDHFGVFLHCQKINEAGPTWSVDTQNTIRVKTLSASKVSSEIFKHKFEKNEGWGYFKFISWDTLTNDYLIDDCIIVEITVKITKMTGIPKKVLRSFDKSAEEFSDVVLEVGGKKFYVLKKFLASHSTYFNALLLGKPEMSEVTIQDTSSVDFQNLLEVLYGEPAIDEDTIDGILTLAHKFTMPLPIQKCEEFLIEKSEKSVKEKLKLVKKYQLKSLKTHCLSKINTPYGINALMPFDHNDMDPEVVMALLKKSLATDEFYLDCIMRFTVICLIFITVGLII
ncbi:BTB domain-containing protein [Caenorhabditis elegans]|uniref:BTB domain-containing protein n=1 Tax=Caenorhabditis elegans TaxID=6239 RepID=O17297_CAEEL|nr:BTB domain-containing protein [Caenorhabditis elegans]CCD67112.1 BTB domain-containing protein [Caenorhabditis elegans]|eukprot:NP_494192.1 SKN-1 Dependent Zygotic transcript [Caenorhabditis elegans]